MNEARENPTYDLAVIQALVSEGRYRITMSSVQGAAHVGFGEAEIVECVLGLALTDFHKTMEARKRPGLWQDVYRPTHRGRRLYVKVQLVGDAATVVVSFKRR